MRSSITKPILATHLLVTILAITVINSGCSKKPGTDTIKQTSITTLQASSITYTSAASGGEIALGTDTSIMERGICYSAKATPTIADSVIVSTSTLDTFNCTLNGLAPNSDYFIRSYFKTASGTVYGNQVTFKTDGGMSPGEPATRIYLSGGYTNDVYALDAVTGAVLWNKKISNASYVSSAIYTNGRVIVKGNNNYLTAFDTLGNVKWTRALDGNNGGWDLIPVIADNGIVYCKDVQYTYAINSSDGSLKWRSDNPNTYTRTDGTLTIKDNVIYVQTAAGGLFTLDKETGDLQWSDDGYGGSMIIYKDVIYLVDVGASTFIFSIDRNTGHLNWLSDPFSTPGNGLANAKNGRIYTAEGWVIDSASISRTHVTLLPSMQFAYHSGTLPGSYPDGGTYPILADNLAISPAGVCDAITGNLICALTGYRGGNQGLSGVTYLNHIVYYTTGQYEIYNPYTGGHWYSDVYAYDVIAKKQLWDTQIENANFFDIEPCVIDRSANAYRGTLSTR